eukprot:TRINITY_DN29212_c0_g3_i1.p1 TRINITY_DN29212_c0_g3~~TRINITY_DN29212_c0_g3_i1.p1  ORF type:complete len:1037 (-),score=128.95 TRINITY_DN29212_c0_g3_i1:210-3320(-)
MDSRNTEQWAYGSSSTGTSRFTSSLSLANERKYGKKLQRHLLSWIPRLPADDPTRRVSAYITAEEVAIDYGVPFFALEKYLEEAQDQADSFALVPLKSVMLFMYCVLIILHKPNEATLSLEHSVTTEIAENANFAFNGSHGFKSINDVNSHTDFWSWLIQGYVPVVFGQSKVFSEGKNATEPLIRAVTYNIPRHDRGFLLGHSRVVGGVRVRQQRSGEQSCDTYGVTGAEEFFAKKCVGGIKHVLSPELPGARLTDSHEREFWLYVQDDLQTILDILYSKETTEEWLDRATQQVEVALPVYSPNLDVHGLISVNFYFSRGGHIWKKIVPASTFASWFPGWWVFTLDVVWVMSLIWSVVKDTKYVRRNIAQQGIRGLVDSTSGLGVTVSFVTSLFGFVLVALFLRRMHISSRLNTTLEILGGIDEVMEQERYRSVVRTYIEVLENELSAVYIFTSAVGAFPLLNLASLGNSVTSMQRLSITLTTFGAAGVDLVHFFVVFLSIYFTFAVVAHLLFGCESNNFASFPRTVFTCFRWMWGDFNWSEIEIVGRLEAGIWFVGFNILVVFVMLNIFVAIIMRSYSKERIKYGYMNTFWSDVKEARARWQGRISETLSSFETLLTAIRNRHDAFSMVPLTNATDGLDPKSGSSNRFDATPRSGHTHGAVADTSSQGESVRVVTVGTLMEVCEDLDETRAITLIAAAVHRYVVHHADKVKFFQIVCLSSKLEWTTRNMKQACKAVIAAADCDPRERHLSKGASIDSMEWENEMYACRADLRSARDAIARQTGRVKAQSRSSLAGITFGEASPSMTVTSPEWRVADPPPFSERSVLVDASASMDARKLVSPSQPSSLLQSGVNCPMSESLCLKTETSLEAELLLSRKALSDASIAASHWKERLDEEKDMKSDIAAELSVLKERVASLEHDHIDLMDEIAGQDEVLGLAGVSQDEYFELVRSLVDENRRLKARVGGNVSLSELPPETVFGSIAQRVRELLRSMDRHHVAIAQGEGASASDIDPLALELRQLRGEIRSARFSGNANR